MKDNIDTIWEQLLGRALSEFGAYESEFKALVLNKVTWSEPDAEGKFYPLNVIPLIKEVRCTAERRGILPLQSLKTAKDFVEKTLKEARLSPPEIP